jgi:hypothetical protein
VTLEEWKKKAPSAVIGNHFVTDGVVHLNDPASCARWAAYLRQIAEWLASRPDDPVGVAQCPHLQLTSTLPARCHACGEIVR